MIKSNITPTVLATAITIALTGCGGSSSSEADPPIVNPAPTPPQLTDCNENQILVPQSIESQGESVEGRDAMLAIDANLSDTSFWTSPTSNASLTLDFGKQHKINEVRIAWHNGETSQQTFDVNASSDNTAFSSVLSATQSSGTTFLPEQYATPDTTARFLQIQTNFTSAQQAGIREILVFGCALEGQTETPSSPFSVASLNLNPDVAPSENFDLLTWALDTPADEDNNNIADRTREQDLANGFEDEFFYTGADGGMVFRSTITGAKTSANTSFTRSELREMLRRGDTRISTRGVNQNNWLLGYQPEVTNEVGGRNGQLSATLSVNQVTQTGSDGQVGRVIIGQIHAEDDEPVRLYYRKHPNSVFGYIYFAHELRGGDDTYRMVYGPEFTDFDSQPNFTAPLSGGLALDDVFSYDIIQAGARVDVFVRLGGLEGPFVGHGYADMNALNSRYDVADEWMYFKAGAYSQNNSGDVNEFDQVTFYRLTNSHD